MCLVGHGVGLGWAARRARSPRVVIGDHRKGNPLRNLRQFPRSSRFVGKLGGEGGKTLRENLLSGQVSCTGGRSLVRCTEFNVVMTFPIRCQFQGILPRFTYTLECPSIRAFDAWALEFR